MPTAVVAELDDADERWQRWLGQLAEKTRAEYRRDFRQWVAWCAEQDVDPQEPMPGDINQWVAALTELGLAPSTVNRKLSAVSSYFAWAEEEGLLAPRQRMPRKRPKVQRNRTRNRPPRLSAEQTWRLLEVARSPQLGRNGPRTLALLSLIVGCGLEVSEAIGVDLPDLRILQGHQVVEVHGRGRRARTVPVPAFTMDAITAYRAQLERRRAASLSEPDAEQGPLFVTRPGRRLDRREAHRTLRRLGGAAGIRGVHPRVLQHTTPPGLHAETRNTRTGSGR